MNNKLYLIVISPEIDREALKSILAAQNNSFWFYNLPNSIFYQSTLSSQQIAKIIEDNFGNTNRYFITEVSNYWGRLPQEHWQYIQK
jgi:hypothetical protein